MQSMNMMKHIVISSERQQLIQEFLQATGSKYKNVLEIKLLLHSYWDVICVQSTPLKSDQKDVDVFTTNIFFLAAITESGQLLF